jgi:S1-C subfamily serine protease
MQAEGTETMTGIYDPPAGSRPPWAPPEPPHDGQAAGQPPSGEPPYGQPPYGQPPYGQPAYGQPPYGQPAYGQPPYGQPSYGQPPYGQPPHGGPYGESPYGGQPYGGQQYGPPYGAQQPYGWPGPGGPGGPYDPYGYGGGGSGGPFRRLRRQLLALAAVVVIAVASFWGLESARSHPSSSVQSTSTIAANVDDGLVDIVTTLGFQRAQAAGTGMVLTSSGEILTNNHVIEGATSIRATDIGNGHTYRAKVVGYDRSHDIAVLKLQGATGLETVTTANSATAAVGERVVALGNAGGKGGTPSVVTGRIIRLGASVTATDASAGTSERLHGLIGHNAPIRPGDSGGPLVNRSGKVIGINTAASTGSNFQLQGGTQAFAIPINQALSTARQIEGKKGSASVHIGATAFLGVGVLSAEQAKARGVQPGSGVVIGDVFPGTAASQAGIRPGDVIVAAGGQRVGSPLALQSVFQRHHPGDRVGLSWLDQSGQRHSANVVLRAGPAA